MENQNILQHFETIEQKVEKLIGVCQSLEKTNSELDAKIGRLKEELQSKVEAENRNEETRTQIRSKIDSLLVRLEDITDV